MGLLLVDCGIVLDYATFQKVGPIGMVSNIHVLKTTCLPMSEMVKTIARETSPTKGLSWPSQLVQLWKLHEG
jgi:hypothetical protein